MSQFPIAYEEKLHALVYDEVHRLVLRAASSIRRLDEYNTRMAVGPTTGRFARKALGFRIGSVPELPAPIDENVNVKVYTPVVYTTIFEIRRIDDSYGRSDDSERGEWEGIVHKVVVSLLLGLHATIRPEGSYLADGTMSVSTRDSVWNKILKFLLSPDCLCWCQYWDVVSPSMDFAGGQSLGTTIGPDKFVHYTLLGDDAVALSHSPWPLLVSVPVAAVSCLIGGIPSV